MTDGRDDVDDAARAYARFLRRQVGEEAPSFEALCAQRPDIANALRILRSLDAEPYRKTSCETFEALVLEQLAASKTANEGRPTGERIPDPPIPEKSTGRYVIRHEVGRGGMGIIFSAWDAELKRSLAMKVMQAREGSRAGDVDLGSRLLGRFLHEARVTGQLDHPGIVPVHDLGMDDEGRIFFTMRLVEGNDLRTVFHLARQRQEGWTPTRVIGVFVKVCEALAYAHAKGVIHRDLKPANIMVGRFGETYVMDWGLAKVVGVEDHHDLRVARTPREAGASGRGAESTTSPVVTMDGTVLGTPAYMPPEQASGSVDELDERSDVYAVGAMLYTLLSGRVPYTEPGSTPSPIELVDAVVRSPPTPISRIHEDAPVELVAICDKAMARSKAERYESMLQLAGDLRAYLENRVVSAYRTGALAELQKWVARNRGMAASIAVTIVLSVAALLAFIFVQAAAKSDLASERDAKSEALVAKEAALAEKDRVLAEKERALVRTEGLRLIANSSSVLADNPALALLLAIEGAAREPGPLADSALLAALAHLREERTLYGHTDQVKAARFSGDGRRVVTAARDGTARVFDVATAEEVLTLTGHRAQVNTVTYSPDGSRIASGSWDTRILLWDAATGREIGSGKHGNVVDFVTFSPDSRLVVSCSRDGTARLWDAVSCQPRAVLAEHSGQVSHAAFSPDGERVATGSHDGTVRIWSVATGERRAVLEGHEAWVNTVAFHGEGDRVLSASADRTARIWSVTGKTRGIVLRGHKGSVYTAEFSPDGERVVTASSDRSARLWDATNGEPLGALDGHTDVVYDARFSPDGGRVITASQDRTARIWDVDTGRELAALRGHDGWVVSARFSLDGSRVVTASNDLTARVWSASTDRDLAAIRRRFDWGGSVAINVPSRRAVVFAHGSEADVRDAVSGRFIAKLEGHTSWIESARFSADGTRVATASRDHTARIWDAATGRELHVLEGHGHWVSDASFSGDGRRVVTASHDFTARVWDAGSGEVVNTLTGHPGWVDAAFFSPDGERIVTVSDDTTARIWAASTGEHLLTLGHGGWVHGAAFSPDGKSVVTASYDKTTRIWDALTGRQIVSLRGHEGEFTGAAFSADRALVATVYRDGTARVWRFPGGDPVITVQAGSSEFLSVRFGEGGETLEAMYTDLTERSWPLSPLRVARARAPRALTPVETTLWEVRSAAERARYRQDWRMKFSRRAMTIARRMWELSPYDRKARSRYFEELSSHARALRSVARDPDAALALLERGLEESREQHPGLLIELASVQARGGELRSAIVALEKAVALPGGVAAATPDLEANRRRIRPDLVSFASADDALSRRDRAVVVDRGAVWRYFPGVTEPSPGVEWTGVGFDDSSWARGASGFGYGEHGQATRLADRPGSRTTLYVRHRFSVENPAAWKRLLLSVRSDDGFVAYLNSREIGRANAGPAGERVPHDGVARRSAAEPLEPVRVWIDPAVLRPGENVLALQGLNRASSADFCLDPVLTAERFSDARRDYEVLAAFRDVAGGEEDRLRVLYLEGLTLARQHRHREAAERLAAVVAADPSSPLPLCRLIESLRAAGDAEAADARVRQLLARPFEPPGAESLVLKDAAWAIVRETGRRPDEYFRALKWAAQASRARAASRSRRTVLAFAQYRMGLYREALGVILMTRMFGEKGDDRRPRELACLAMAHARLGQSEQALSTLEKLREVVTTDGRSSDPEVQAVLAEAEAVCGAANQRGSRRRDTRVSSTRSR